MEAKNSMSRQNRRIWILTNYLSIVFILSFFYAGKYFNWPLLIIVGQAASILLLIASSFLLFSRTPLWKMSHTSNDNLDERQQQVVLTSLKYSYSIFTIVVLLIVYGFALAEHGPIDVVVAACLLYFAHTLPSAIVGWKEKFI